MFSTHVKGHDWLGLKPEDYFVKQSRDAGRPVVWIARHRFGRDENDKMYVKGKYSAWYAPSLKPAPESVVFAHTTDDSGTCVIRGFFSHVDEADDFLVQNNHFGCERSGVSEAALPYQPATRITRES